MWKCNSAEKEKMHTEKGGGKSMEQFNLEPRERFYILLYKMQMRFSILE